MAQKPTRGSDQSLSMTARSKKAAAVKPVDPADRICKVELLGRAVISIKAILIESFDTTSITIHRRPPHSRSIVVQTYNMEDVVSIEGAEGEAGVICVYTTAVIATYEGRVEPLDGNFVEVILDNGQSVILNRSSPGGIEVQISYQDDAATINHAAPSRSKSKNSSDTEETFEDEDEDEAELSDGSSEDDPGEDDDSGDDQGEDDPPEEEVRPKRTKRKSAASGNVSRRTTTRKKTTRR